jgi:PAS domain-containing protein
MSVERLMLHTEVAVSLVRPDGRIIYENGRARRLLGRDVLPAETVLSSLAVPTFWDELMDRLQHEKSALDLPVLLQTVYGDAELCYASIFPLHDEQGVLDALACVWLARRESPSPSGKGGPDAADVPSYTRDLEGVIEHRTYQHLLAAEQNEYARDALDALPTGILIVSTDGEIVYRNRAMSDDFGLRPADYPEPMVRHFLAPELLELFRRVVDNGLRACAVSTDPGGNAAAVDVLPLLRSGAVKRVALHFCRRLQAEGRA